MCRKIFDVWLDINVPEHLVKQAVLIGYTPGQTVYRDFNVGDEVCEIPHKGHYKIYTYDSVSDSLSLNGKYVYKKSDWANIIIPFK